jgi:hypothetical protein
MPAWETVVGFVSGEGWGRERVHAETRRERGGMGRSWNAELGLTGITEDDGRGRGELGKLE